MISEVSRRFARGPPEVRRRSPELHWKNIEIFVSAMVGLGAPNPTIALGTSSDLVPKGMVHLAGAPSRHSVAP